MRIDCRVDAYDVYEKATIFLDGNEIKEAIMADDEKGIVELYKIGSDGECLSSNNELLTYYKHGKVEIRGLKCALDF